MTERDKNRFKLISKLGGSISHDEYIKHECYNCKRGSLDGGCMRILTERVYITLKDYSGTCAICLEFEKK